MNYELKRTEERVGTLTLALECLADLNRTIDDLFVELERQGKPELLESLCPYFGTIWPSARALASKLFDLLSGMAPHARSRLTILELGCGLALPSLACARLGAQVTATDFHPEVPRFLERNRELNGLSELRFVPLDWQNAAEPLGRFDWIVGSDILYERQHPPAVAEALRRQAGPETRILIADPGRPYLQSFADEMERLGFASQVQPHQEIFLLDFTPRNPGRSRSPDSRIAPATSP